MNPTKKLKCRKAIPKKTPTLELFLECFFPVISISTCFVLIFCSPFYDECHFNSNPRDRELNILKTRVMHVTKCEKNLLFILLFQWRETWRAFVGKTEMLHKRTNLNHSAFHCLGVNNIRLRHVATPPTPLPPSCKTEAGSQMNQTATQHSHRLPPNASWPGNCYSEELSVKHKCFCPSSEGVRKR